MASAHTREATATNARTLCGGVMSLAIVGLALGVQAAEPEKDMMPVVGQTFLSAETGRNARPTEVGQPAQLLRRAESQIGKGIR
jgi:hypothetical protein